MKTINYQIKEDNNKNSILSIKNHLCECYKMILYGEKIASVINKHKIFINKFNLHGKNKYKTLQLLYHFKNTRNKAIAINTLLLSLNNLNLLNDLDLNHKHLEFLNSINNNSINNCNNNSMNERKSTISNICL